MTPMDDDEEPTFLCPTCGGGMQWRRNKTSGSRFLGCLRWPHCNGTRSEQGIDSRVAPHVQARLHRFLRAAVLASEDECLTFSSELLERVDKYELHITELSEEKSFVLTVQEKK